MKVYSKLAIHLQFVLAAEDIVNVCVYMHYLILLMEHSSFDIALKKVVADLDSAQHGRSK